MSVLKSFYIEDPIDPISKLPVDCIMWIPIILGAAATAGGIAIKQGEERKARNRANAQFEILRKNQRQHEDDANSRLQKSIKDFTPAEREALENEVVAENAETLGSALARDRAAIEGKDVGNVSQQFIDRKAGVKEGLEERGKEKVGLRANVLAPGIANFFEKEKLLEAAGQQNTNRLLARGRLGVDTNAVEAAAIPRGNFAGDALLALGPALASFGAFAPAGAAASTALTPGVTAALAPGAAVNTALAGGAGLTTAQQAALGIGAFLSAGANSPRRGFTTIGA